MSEVLYHLSESSAEGMCVFWAADHASACREWPGTLSAERAFFDRELLVSDFSQSRDLNR